jgi:putative membrane protein
MTSPDDSSAGRSAPDVSSEASADRRTSLAVERTQLAWWRTGLTSLAVAIGVGRVVPELSDSDTTWPYAVVGVAFAVYGIALFAQGTKRGRVEGRRDGAAGRPSSRTDLALAGAGVALGLVVIVLIVLA